MHTFSFELFADYFQFYLQDESSQGDLSDSWNEEATERLLAVAPGIVGVGTVRNMNVSVIIEIMAAEPDPDSDLWEHVTACSLEVKSGKIVVAGCTDYLPDAARIEVEAGTYSIRVSYRGLKLLSEDGLDGEDNYRLQLWKGPPVEPYVIKQRDD